MATSRAGGVLLLNDFAGSPRIHGRSFAGNSFALGFVRPIRTANGGVHLLDDRAGSSKYTPIPVTTFSLQGGVHLLDDRPGSDKSTSIAGDPEITNRSPAPDATVYPGDTVSFDISDVVPLFFIEVQVDQIRREVIHDGDEFLTPYLTSIRIPISGGWRYQIRRTGGWIAPPTFRVRAFDTNLIEG